MRIVRTINAPCGHPTGCGFMVVHNGHWLCPHCAAVRFFDRNTGLMCERARAEKAAGREIDAFALCLMAKACGARCNPSSCPAAKPLEVAV